MTGDERELESHFAFGENWSRFSRSLTREHLDHATSELIRLLGRSDLSGVRMLDLGCGSGLHSVAAAELGAQVVSVDIDPDSVRTTIEVARTFGLGDRIDARVASVFELEPSEATFDLVYSWGVLHHTGDMWTAIRRAAALVSREPAGELVIAIYRKTKLCAFWKVEKRLYAKAPALLQLPIRLLFTLFGDLLRLFRGATPWRHRAEYRKSRGMEAKYDVHDWLGGYPYESATPSEVRAFLANLGFEERASFVQSNDSIPLGLGGSGCDEYRFGVLDVVKTGGK